jgi:hypothetical protein
MKLLLHAITLYDRRLEEKKERIEWTDEIHLF